MLWCWCCHSYNLKGGGMCGQSLSTLVNVWHCMECKGRAHLQRLGHKKDSCTKHCPCFDKHSTWMDWGYLCFEMRKWSCFCLTGIERSNLKLKKNQFVRKSCISIFVGSHVVTHYVTVKFNFRMWVSCPQNHISDYIEIFKEPRTNQNVRHSMRQNSLILQYGVRVCCNLQLNRGMHPSPRYQISPRFLTFIQRSYYIKGIIRLKSANSNICRLTSVLYAILRFSCKQWRRQNDNWGGGGRIFIYVRSA